MNYLIDTHILLWTLFSSKKISKREKSIFSDGESTKFVSIITFWEISLKFSLKKIYLQGVLPEQLPSFAKEAGFDILPFDIEQAASFYKLPKLANNDPFDRMLCWQAISKDLFLITADKEFEAYKKFGLKVVF